MMHIEAITQSKVSKLQQDSFAEQKCISTVHAIMLHNIHEKQFKMKKNKTLLYKMRQIIDDMVKIWKLLAPHRQ